MLLNRTAFVLLAPQQLAEGGLLKRFKHARVTESRGF